MREGPPRSQAYCGPGADLPGLYPARVVAVRTTRDHYVVLGVPRDADRVQVRKAYRALAAALHPDVCDDPDAPERFREVVAAYKVLSDPDSRRRYDRIGMSRRAPFDDLFATRGAPAPRTGERGEDIRVDASVELPRSGAWNDPRADVRRGRRLHRLRRHRRRRRRPPPPLRRLRRLRPGSRGGKRRPRAHDPLPRVPRLPRQRLGRRSPVWDVRGRGTCLGGARDRVTIPPGSSDGDEILLAGEGHAGGHGGPSGDVVVTLCVREAPDSPLVRYLAAAGAVCAAILLVVTLLLPLACSAGANAGSAAFVTLSS